MAHIVWSLIIFFFGGGGGIYAQKKIQILEASGAPAQVQQRFPNQQSKVLGVATSNSRLLTQSRQMRKLISCPVSNMRCPGIPLATSPFPGLIDGR